MQEGKDHYSDFIAVSQSSNGLFTKTGGRATEHAQHCRQLLSSSRRHLCPAVADKRWQEKIHTMLSFVSLALKILEIFLPELLRKTKKKANSVYLI